MDLIFKTILSMSLSGALFGLALLLGGRIWKNGLSRQWRYYIWLVVVMRLLLPFGPEASLMGRLYQTMDGMTVQGDSAAPETAFKQDDWDAGEKSGSFVSEGMAPAGNCLGAIWLAVALGMLIRKIMVYRSYLKYVRAQAAPVRDAALLNRLALTKREMGIGREVELCENPRVASPMLVGYFHPSIILPDAGVSEQEFRWMAMHELTHCKRRDILYKWLVQLTVCLHWFNPFVYRMRREIEEACEFSCDEAVVAKAGYVQAADYGKTLLNAMAAAGTCREPLAAVTMSADKELLRERLGAIMNCKKRTNKAKIITIGLTGCIALGIFFFGIYPAAAAGTKRDETPKETEIFPQEMTVAMPVCRIREGAGEWFLAVDLIAEGETVTVLRKEEGKDGQMWYLLDGDSLSEQPDDAAKECYIRADLLRR